MTYATSRPTTKGDVWSMEQSLKDRMDQIIVLLKKNNELQQTILEKLQEKEIQKLKDRVAKLEGRDIDERYKT